MRFSYSQWVYTLLVCTILVHSIFKVCDVYGSQLAKYDSLQFSASDSQMTNSFDFSLSSSEDYPSNTVGQILKNGETSLEKKRKGNKESVVIRAALVVLIFVLSSWFYFAKLRDKGIGEIPEEDETKVEPAQNDEFIILKKEENQMFEEKKILPAKQEETDTFQNKQVKFAEKAQRIIYKEEDIRLSEPEEVETFKKVEPKKVNHNLRKSKRQNFFPNGGVVRDRSALYSER